MKGRFEIAVGFVFIIAMAILGYYTIIMSGEIIRPEDTYAMSALFDNIEGLRIKSNVKVNGVVSGVVDKIELHDHKVKVTFRMYNKFNMYENYYIAIKSESALGGKGISIYPGAPVNSLGQEFDEIFERENLNGDMEDILGSISRILEDNKDNIKMTIQNIRDITDKINNGKGTLGKLLNEDSVHSDANNLVKEMRDAIEDAREQAPVTSFIRAALTAF